MSASSASTQPVQGAPVPAPSGWSNDDELLERSYYWDSKNPDGVNLPAFLENVYGLMEVQPVWTQHPKHGNVLFIFEAQPDSRKKTYYIWNGVADSFSQIVPETLDEIRSIIEDTGRGAGYLKELEVRPVVPKDGEK